MQLHEHRCSYCDHDHAISPKEIRTAWAFVKCEACGKLSILKGGGGAREQPIARQTTSSAIPKPPPFLSAPPQPEKKPRAQQTAAAPVASARPIPAPLPPASAPPSRRRAELWTRIRHTARERRGPIYAGILIIAIGLLILSAQRLRGQAERLAELSLVPEINPTSAPAVATPPAASAPRAQAPADVAPAPALASAPAPVPASAPIAAPPDAVRTSSAEPARPFQIEIAKEAVLLRSGPGTNYRRVGAADLGARLPVLEWRGDWFRVGLNPDGGAQATTAWVRDDLVHRVE